MKESKLKTWIEEHKEEFKAEGSRILWYGIGFGVAWFVSGELATRRAALHVAELNNVGVLKFINPSTGSEVTVKEACDIVKKMYD